jgi:hypothetical protein
MIARQGSPCDTFSNVFACFFYLQTAWMSEYPDGKLAGHACTQRIMMPRNSSALLLLKVMIARQ